MPFQYREFFKTSQEKLKYFDQLDLYFYKANSTAVGIKARFTASQYLPNIWTVKQIQLKLIENYKDVCKDITDKLTIFEKWKKVRIPVQFKVLSLEYLEEHLTEENTCIQEKIKQHLKQVCNRINNAIKGSKDLQQRHFAENKHLQDWIKRDDNLEEVYAIQKSRDKSSSTEEGFISIVPLFKKFEINNQPLYRTVAYEQATEPKLIKLLAKNLVNPTKNVSYPSFLQLKHSEMPQQKKQQQTH